MISHYALHNVTETEPCNAGGVYLRRFPSAVRNILSPLGGMVAEESAGVEIRFVTEADGFRITLGAEPPCVAPSETSRLEVFVFRGDFFHSRHLLEEGRQNHLTVTDIGGVLRTRFASLSPEALADCRFSPNVWRIQIGRFSAALIELSTFGKPSRPPRPDELPAKRWLAYGSSITNGGNTSGHHLTYIYQAAHHLGIDVFNQGLSGSCLCETEVADYLAARQDWDIITLELGVNMRQDFSPEDFAQRAAHLVAALARAHPDKPIGLISIFPNADLPPFAMSAETAVARRQRAFVEILQDLTSKSRGKVFFLNGSSILKEFRGLSTDLIHPSDFGHIEMGRWLAAQLTAHLGD